jgi:23S rRNA (uracil1939-C5)-methyltransferase
LRASPRPGRDAPPADEAIVSIERLAGGGEGVGRLPDGRAIFVAFTAPGDRVRVRVVESRKRFARGSLLAVLEPGPARREPRCAVHGVCGGCDWQHLAYPAQLEAKRGILVDALERVGRLAVPGEVQIIGSPREFGYRSRARLLRRDGRVGFRRRRSHELCAVERCPVLEPALDAELARLAAAAPGLGEGEVELAAASDLQVGAESLRISPGVFAQANPGLLEGLVEAVIAPVAEMVNASAPLTLGTILELYAGAGLFTLPLARLASPQAGLLAVESNPQACEDLSVNLARAGLADRVRIRVEPVEQALDNLDEERPSVAVLDPPRIGMAPGAADRLARLGPSRIVYVSCNPATLARDLALLCAGGYSLGRVVALDMFPQTAHVEAVALLDRV